MIPDPYLSVVVTSRNDNHGGTLTRRMQIFVDSLIAQCRRFDLATELIFVEWNPPGDRPRLAEALRWPAEMSPCVVRIIEVPAELHARYKHGGKLPLYQMIAKNVGIRRWRGAFILATNIDIIFNDELMAFLAARKLERGKMYRIDRTDVDTDVPEGAPIEETLRYCQTHQIRINSREGTFALRSDGALRLGADDVADADALVTIASGIGPLEYTHEQTQPRACRWLTNDAQIILDAVEGPEQLKFLVMECEFGPSTGHAPLPIHFHDDTGREILSKTLFPGDPISVPVVLKRHSQQLLLHLESPELSSGGDPRFMNLLVRRVELRDQPPTITRPPDIVEADCRCCLGSGWYDLEQWKEQKFRWINNDAKIYVESPSAGTAQRHLSLEVALGPGTDYEPVTVSIFDDAQQLVTRQALWDSRLLSTSVALHPGTNTFTVHIDGPNLARSSDGYVLNIMVSRVAISAEPLPDRARFDIIDSDIALGFGKGWYNVEEWEGGKLRWMNNDARIYIEGPASETERRYLLMNVEPGPATDFEPVTFSLSNQHHEPLVQQVLWSPRLLCVPVDLHPGLNIFTLHVDGPSRPRLSDGNVLNVKFTRIALTRQPETHREPSDIIASDIPMALGRGWYEPELWEGKLLRWLNNDARIYFHGPPGPVRRRYIILDFEQGPGTNFEPVGVTATDDRLTPLLQTALFNYSTLSIPVDVRPGINSITLRIQGPNVQRPGDGNVLNLKVLRIGMADEPAANIPVPDITEGSVPIHLGAGWYPRETWEGQHLRWLHNDAKIYLQIPEGARRVGYIGLDVEPGPSAGEAPVPLQITDDSGQTLLETLIVRRQVISLPVTLDPGVQALVLRVRSPDLAIAGDTRVLNLKVRRVELSDSAIPWSAAPEITSGTAIRLGSEFDALEFYDARHSRWLFGGANLWVICPSVNPPPCQKVLYLELEGGPSLGPTPQPVRLLDDRNHEVARTLLKEPQTLRIPISLAASVQRFRLEFESPNLAFPGDARLLNVKMLRIELF